MSHSLVDFNFTNSLQPFRLPSRDGRFTANYYGTGRSCAEKGCDPRNKGDFGLVSSPRYQKRGLAMEKLDLYLERKPKGWAEPPKYVTASQRQYVADKERAAEARAAARKELADKAKAEAAKECTAKLAAERKAAKEQEEHDAELQRTREAVFSWAGREEFAIGAPLAASLGTAFGNDAQFLSETPQPVGASGERLAAVTIGAR